MIYIPGGELGVLRDVRAKGNEGSMEGKEELAGLVKRSDLVGVQGSHG